MDKDGGAETRSRGFLILLCSLVGYAAALFTSLHAAGFVGNFLVPNPMDAVARMPVFAAVVVDLNLIAVASLALLFLARLIGMRSRAGLVPEGFERSTGLLVGSLVFTAVLLLWQPTDQLIWQTEESVARGVLHCMCISGWLLLLGATFLTGHADLFGLRAAWRHCRGQSDSASVSRSPGLAHWLRDSSAVGWLLLVWSTPAMSAGHLLLAIIVSTLALVVVAGRWPNLRRCLVRSLPRFA